MQEPSNPGDTQVNYKLKIYVSCQNLVFRNQYLSVTVLDCVEDVNVPPQGVGKNDHGRYHISIVKVHYRNGVIHKRPGHASLA